MKLRSYRATFRTCEGADVTREEVRDLCGPSAANKALMEKHGRRLLNLRLDEIKGGTDAGHTG